MKTAYGVPSDLVTEPGPTAYGVPVRTRGTSSASSTASSRRRPNGPGSAVTCTAPAPSSRTTSRHHLLGTSAAHHQRAVGGGPQRGERAQQPGGARRAGPAEQPGVEHEQRQDAAAGRLLGRRLQGGVVVEAQVAAQPQHGVGHPATLAPTRAPAATCRNTPGAPGR